jgi:terminal uridylyltransferase
MIDDLHVLLRLVDFFKYYSREFPYNTEVVSIRAGFMTKESKGWAIEV